MGAGMASRIAVNILSKYYLIYNNILKNYKYSYQKINEYFIYCWKNINLVSNVSV